MNKYIKVDKKIFFLCHISDKICELNTTVPCFYFIVHHRNLVIFWHLNTQECGLVIEGFIYIFFKYIYIYLKPTRVFLVEDWSMWCVFRLQACPKMFQETAFRGLSIRLVKDKVGCDYVTDVCVYSYSKLSMQSNLCIPPPCCLEAHWLSLCPFTNIHLSLTEDVMMSMMELRERCWQSQFWTWSQIW